METGIKYNPHSFRRGFAVHQGESGLSTRVVQALGGCETIAMFERYSKHYPLMMPFSSINRSAVMKAEDGLATRSWSLREIQPVVE